LFACFVAVLVTWMSFASDGRELRGDVLSMLETHIMMSSLIFRCVLILMFRLAFTLVLRLRLFHVLCLSSLMDLTIAHMVLVHKRTALSLDALGTTHVLIMLIVSHVDLVFPLEGPSHPTRPSSEVQRTVKTSSSRMVKCWIPKIYLTNPSTKPSTFSHPM
jgi:hypothetical protein